jgi:hypothetical protein
LTIKKPSDLGMSLSYKLGTEQDKAAAVHNALQSRSGSLEGDLCTIQKKIGRELAFAPHHNTRAKTLSSIRGLEGALGTKASPPTAQSSLLLISYIYYVQQILDSQGNQK